MQAWARGLQHGLARAPVRSFSHPCERSVMVTAGSFSGEDVRRFLENTSSLLTAAGAVDFDDGQTIAGKIAEHPEDFMMWSRKKTSTRKVASGVISVYRLLQPLRKR